MTHHRRSWRRKVTIGCLVVFGAWVLFAVWLLGTAWRRVPGYAPASTPTAASLILTPGDYAAVIDSHERPYVYAIDASSGGRIVVFGAEHTKDPGDSQLESIRDRWRRFSNRRHGRPGDPEAFVRDTFRERSTVEGLSGALTSMEAVDAA